AADAHCPNRAGAAECGEVGDRDQAGTGGGAGSVVGQQGAGHDGGAAAIGVIASQGEGTSARLDQATGVSENARDDGATEGSAGVVAAGGQPTGPAQLAHSVARQ